MVNMWFQGSGTYLLYLLQLASGFLVFDGETMVLADCMAGFFRFFFILFLNINASLRAN